MKTLRCEITGKEITSGYWSPASGYIFDEKEILDRLKTDERDPISHRPLKIDELVPIQHNYTIDSFAASVGALHSEIETLRSLKTQDEREIRALKQGAGGASSNGNSNQELIKKTFQAKYENLEKLKNREIDDLMDQISNLKAEMETMETVHLQKRNKMLAAVKEREEFWSKQVK